VNNLTRLSRIAALSMMVGTVASAQDPWSLAFKMAGGPTFQKINEYTGKAGYTLGGDFELGYQLSKTSQVAFSLGYRFFPGDFQQVSIVPTPLPTRAAIGVYTLEHRVRKADVQGFQLAAIYRSDLAQWAGAYWQGGVRIGINKAKEIDTGTTYTQTTTVINSAGTLTAGSAIATVSEKTKVYPGLTAGAGYRFNDSYSLEANWYMTGVTSPSTGVKQSGQAVELSFGIRF